MIYRKKVLIRRIKCFLFCTSIWAVLIEIPCEPRLSLPALYVVSGRERHLELCMLGRHFSESCYSEYNAWPPATHSISSERAFLTANICTCLTETAKRFWSRQPERWTDPQLKAKERRGGGTWEASHSQKNIYHGGATVTNQWRLENMISPGKECKNGGAPQG